MKISVSASLFPGQIRWPEKKQVEHLIRSKSNISFPFWNYPITMIVNQKSLWIPMVTCTKWQKFFSRQKMSVLVQKMIRVELIRCLPLLGIKKNRAHVWSNYGPLQGRNKFVQNVPGPNQFTFGPHFAPANHSSICSILLEQMTTSVLLMACWIDTAGLTLWFLSILIILKILCVEAGGDTVKKLGKVKHSCEIAPEIIHPFWPE